MAFTFFFRDEQVLSLAVKNLVQFAMGRTNVHILNAGCAMGMETYTFAILLAESMGKFAIRNLKIHAIDIDNENVDFGKTLTNGVYHEQYLQRIPNGLFNKYFSPAAKANHFIVSEELRRLVRFQRHDLLTLQPLRDDYSLIICKNVLLHFDQQQRIDVLKSFHHTMLEGGLLAMENTQSIPEELQGKFNKKVGYAQLYEKI